ncbi:MAG TPA: hypothetical protein VGQ52_15610 [Gemmatimonadaceae bacterium]|nr:hypothetical protein [Gemmatimonadaceae bacterium]
MHSGWLFVIAMLPFAVLTAHHWNWGAPPGFGDHAQYLAHARAIVEGRAYTDIGYIYHPAAPMLGPRAYPPGLPLTLAPIVALFGVDSPMNQVLMIVSIVAFAYLAFRRLELAIAPWQAALAVGFAALGVESRFGSVVPLSDPGFCALLWGLVLAVDTTSRWTWQRIALVTALGFAAMAYRIPGVAVVPALTLYALVTWRQHGGRALIPVALWAVAGVAVLLSGMFDLPFRQYLLPRLDEIGDRITSMSRVYKASVFDLELYAFPREKLNDAYHLIASLLLVAGAGALLWRYRRTMLTATVLAYVAILFVSPVSDGRYLWPMYPVLAAGMVIGATAVSRSITRYVRWYPRSAVPVAIALVIIMLGALRAELGVSAPLSLDRLPDAKQLFAWMRDRNNKQPMRAMFVNPRVLSIETGVASMGALALRPHLQLHALREREISHIVWQNTETNNCRARLLNSLPRIYPKHFVLEYQNPTFRVYRFDQADATPNEIAASFEVSPAVCRELPRS